MGIVSSLYMESGIIKMVEARVGGALVEDVLCTTHITSYRSIPPFSVGCIFNKAINF